jgi:hypothetical protein
MRISRDDENNLWFFLDYGQAGILARSVDTVANWWGMV